MKILAILLSIFSLLNFSYAKCNNQKTDYVWYDGEIKNIFIHSLIAYPEVLQTKSKNTIVTYHTDCIDYIEFENLLNELYKNNYVLVDIHKTFTTENGITKKCKVKVPCGKKPVAIGVDDVVYDPKKSGNGMVDRLCVDSNENIYTETLIDGKIDKKYDREFAPILENFLTLYPSFSPFGDRITINLTGFCGILGYRISDKNEMVRNTETEKVQTVIKTLKQLGYTFACHSYAHYHTKKVSAEFVKQDLADWQRYIEPVIGKTKVFVYPYGEWELATGNQISEKQKVLIDFGFKLFLGVGIYDFYGYMPLSKNINSKILFADRKPIDGYTLIHRQNELNKLFDYKKVLSDFAKQREKCLA